MLILRKESVRGARLLHACDVHLDSHLHDCHGPARMPLVSVHTHRRHCSFSQVEHVGVCDM